MSALTSRIRTENKAKVNTVDSVSPNRCFSISSIANITVQFVSTLDESSVSSSDRRTNPSGRYIKNLQ